MPEIGREYAFATPAGKPPLMTPTAVLESVRRAGTLGQLLPFAHSRRRTSRRPIHIRKPPIAPLGASRSNAKLSIRPTIRLTVLAGGARYLVQNRHTSELRRRWRHSRFLRAVQRSKPRGRARGRNPSRVPLRAADVIIRERGITRRYLQHGASVDSPALARSPSMQVSHSADKRRHIDAADLAQ